jgi:hypothetical protein
MLEYHGDTVRRPSGSGFAMNKKRSAAEIGKAGDAAQQSSLAAAGGTDEAHDLVLPDHKRQGMERNYRAIKEKLARTIDENRRLIGMLR